MESPLPRDVIAHDEVQSLIQFTRSLLSSIDDFQNEGDVDPPKILKWFLEAVDDDERVRQLFSRPFLAKYEELDGDVTLWVEWAKGEFDRLSAEADAVMRQELSRGPGMAGRLKWRVRARIFTASHTLRPKALKFWNERIELVKLISTGKKDELLLELNLSEAVTISDLYGHALGVTKMVLAFLSIGSTGYFWFEKPAYRKAVFEQIEDMDRPDFKIATNLQRINWNTDPPMPLTEQYLYNAIVCLHEFAPMNDQVAEPIFGPYFHGLALIAKSDVHVSTDNLARISFNASLRAALRHFGVWEGSESSFGDALNRGFQRIIPDAEHREIAFAALNSSSPQDGPVGEATVMTKRLTDLFLIETAQQRWQQSLRSRGGWRAEIDEPIPPAG